MSMEIQKRKLTIGLITDIHFAETEKIANRRPSASYSKLEQAVKLFKNAKVDFVIALGDIINSTKIYEADRAALYKITSLLADLKVYYIWGNHDSEGICRDELEAVANGMCAPYIIESGNNKIILLDNNFKKDGSRYITGENTWWDTFCPEEQLLWLDSALATTKGEALVFTHQIIDIEANTAAGVANAPDVRAVLEKYGNVHTVYQGHRHEGGYSKINGIEYINLKAMCESEVTDPDVFATVIEF